ncbi:unnamed protein product, partial [Nesidiocoris tenuis]
MNLSNSTCRMPNFLFCALIYGICFYGAFDWYFRIFDALSDTLVASGEAAIGIYASFVTLASLTTSVISTGLNRKRIDTLKNRIETVEEFLTKNLSNRPKRGLFKLEYIKCLAILLPMIVSLTMEDIVVIHTTTKYDYQRRVLLDQALIHFFDDLSLFIVLTIVFTVRRFDRSQIRLRPWHDHRSFHGFLDIFIPPFGRQNPMLQHIDEGHTYRSVQMGFEKTTFYPT